MSDVDVLESVLAKDARLLENVSPDQYDGPTPTCPGYGVRGLMDHLVGWARHFADGANGREPGGDDPGAYTTDDHAAEFRKAADDLVAGWRTHGTDRPVRFGTNDLPGGPVLGMTLMEYVTHGLDLAIATGQDVPFTDDELETTLGHAKANLPDELRGDAFAPAVTVADDAPAVDRLLAFMGRTRP